MRGTGAGRAPGGQRLGVVLLAAVVLATGAAEARVPARTRIEVEAAVPAGADARRGSSVRQQVVERGIRDAVDQVAGRYANPGAPAALLPEMGGTARDYVLGYRIVETLGERPARLLRGDRNAPKTEYAAVIEVSVDTRRVTSALAAAGLWTPEQTSGVMPAGQFVLEAPLEWAAWTRLRDALLAAGAARVVPDQVTAEGMSVRIIGAADPAGLLRAVRRDPPEGLVLDSVLGSDPVRVRARFEAP